MATRSVRDAARIATILLLAGAVVTTATQLRQGSTPLGPGEALIVLGIMLSLVADGRSRIPVTDAVGREYLLFWVLSGALLGFGALSGAVIESQPGASAAYDAIAYVFVAILCISIETRSSRDPAYALVTLTYAASAVLVATGVIGLLIRDVSGLHLWYDIVRLRGFSENPNQLALLAISPPFLCWQLLQDRQVKARRLLWALSLLGLVVGLMTLSDALFVSWASAFLLVSVVIALRVLRRLQSAVKALFLVALTVGLAAALVLSGVVGQWMAALLQLGSEAYESGAQGSVRVALWRHAIEALSRTWMLGLGPGAHSGLDGPFQQTEAHNSYIDWTAATGLLGLAVLGAVLATAVARCIRSERVYLGGALLGLMVFGAFHHVLRQPLFWCCLITISYYARMAGRQQSVFADRRSAGIRDDDTRMPRWGPRSDAREVE